MPETVAGSAEERIIEAFYTLLREKPYSAIKVTEIIRLADVNRSTFYKKYTSVPDLFQALQRETADALMSVPADPPHTPQELESFAQMIFTRFWNAHSEEVALLGGDHGDVRTLWYIGEKIQQRLTQVADAGGITDEKVRKNIQAAPGFAASTLCYRIYQTKLRAIWDSAPDVTYDETKSFFENVAEQLQKRRGGTLQFHYDLLLSYVKFFDRFQPRVTVTQLLQTAGIGRTEFYQYYKNIEDFHRLYYSMIRNCATLYVVKVCRSDADTGAGMLTAFFEINYNFVQKTLWGVMERGDIIYYITTLIGAAFGVLAPQTPEHGGPVKKREYDLLYYVGSYVSYALAYYSGQLPLDALRGRLHALDGLRKKLGFGGAANG